MKSLLSCYWITKMCGFSLRIFCVILKIASFCVITWLHVISKFRKYFLNVHIFENGMPQITWITWVACSIVLLLFALSCFINCVTNRMQTRNFIVVIANMLKLVVKCNLPVLHKLFTYFERLAAVRLVVRCWRIMLCLDFAHVLPVEK